MFSEPVRRAAMDEASDVDRTTLSGKVTLVQETDQDVQAGFLMYVPVYRKGLPTGTVAERRAAWLGYVYSPLRAKQFIQGIFPGGSPDLHLQVFDGRQTTPESLLFASNDQGGNRLPAHAELTTDRVIELYGHQWTLRLSAKVTSSTARATKPRRAPGRWGRAWICSPGARTVRHSPLRSALAPWAQRAARWLIGNESSGREIHPCELYRNNGNGTFTEVAAESGVAVQAYVKGVAAGDDNNDGLPDLYLSVINGPNYLFRNDGPQDAPGAGKPKWKFSDVTQAAGVAEPRFSFPTWFFDYDNDGRLHLFVIGYRIANAGDVAADYMGLPHSAERARLYHNNGDGTFTDVTKTARL